MVGGFGLADTIGAARGRARVRAVALALAFLLPVNAIAFAACFATPTLSAFTPAEAGLARWIREHTPRDGLIIDDEDQVVFLVTAPRRYYWGCWAYAYQWGYPKEEMSRRLHVRRALYSPQPLDGTTLEILGGVREPLYVVVRPGHGAAGAAVTRRPDLFPVVHAADDMALVRVDAAACRAAAAGQTDRVSTEELIRDAGL